jgi:hypothetical protein
VSKPTENNSGPVPDVGPNDVRAISQQVERILASDLIKGSRSLHGLLRFIVEAKLDGRDDEIKETVLATEVFGRRADFDGRADPVARVHAHRLRKKLKEYYEGQGANDPWIIRIPAGTYVPEINRAAPHPLPAQPTPSKPPTLVTPAQPLKTPPPSAPPGNSSPASSSASSRSRVRERTLGVIAATSLLFAAVVWIRAQGPGPRPVSATERLWADFLAPDAAPTSIVFNEVVFLSNDKVLLRYDGPFSGPTGAGFASPEEVKPYVDSELLDRVGPLLFNRTYGSIGQVYSIRALSLLFARSGKEPALRPFRLLRPDEPSIENLILSEISNLAALNLSLEHYRRIEGSFNYQASNPPAIEATDPVDGSTVRYALESDARTHERKVDYAVVAWLPGRKPHLRVVLIQGLTSAGSWAATKAVTTDDGVEELERMLGTPRPEFFEALVRAEIEHDQVMSFSFVSATPRSSGH